MFKKDFIVRQFEEFGKVLGKILGFKLQSDWQKFEVEISNALTTFTGLELKQIEEMDLGQFNLAVVGKNELSPDQIKILARLMFERLEGFLIRGDESCISIQKEKCKLLYEKAAMNLTQNEYDIDIHYKLEYLRTL